MYTVIEKSLYKIRERDAFRYIDEGPATERPPVLFLHGMLGNLTNWTDAVQAVAANGYRAIVPMLPVYTLPKDQTSLRGLVQYVHEFLDVMNLEFVTLAGNSAGGATRQPVYSHPPPARMRADTHRFLGFVRSGDGNGQPGVGMIQTLSGTGQPSPSTKRNM